MAAYIGMGVAVGCGYCLTSGTSQYEKMWRSFKDFPHYQYLARPVFKLVASHSNTAIATAASFFVTELLMHQLLPQAAMCGLNNIVSYPSPCDISWNVGKTLGWVSLALPIMYAKYSSSKALPHSPTA